MLKELRISNFKIFDDEAVIQFRPITVLIGNNNAGKSSVINFLLLLQQSLGSQSKGFLESRGHQVDLGEFYSLKNTMSSKRSLKFSVQFQREEKPGDVLSIYLKSKGVVPDENNLVYELNGNIRYDKSGVFRGKETGSRLLSKNRVLFRHTEKITENSRFLEFPDLVREDQQLDQDTYIETAVKNYCYQIMASGFGNISCIASNKAVLQRTFDSGEQYFSNYVGKTGKFALHHLLEQYKDSSSFEFISRHVEKILRIEDIEFVERGELAQCEATNSVTGSRSNIAEFGIGIHQCLPIIIQGSMMYPQTTLVVEQPECMVHPTAQLEMGSFFAKLWNDKKICSIIETHSKNILLRLRRLVVHGKLKPSDVSIVFFDFVNDKCDIKNLDIEPERGSVNGLPMEFFAANVGESLKMGISRFDLLPDSNV